MKFEFASQWALAQPLFFLCYMRKFCYDMVIKTTNKSCKANSYAIRQFLEESRLTEIDAKERRSMITYLRVPAGMLLFVSILFCSSYFVGFFPANNILDIILAFIIGLILTPIIASPIEWTAHRYICHSNFGLFRRIYSIHLNHHLKSFTTKNPIEIRPTIYRLTNYLRSLQQGDATYLTTFSFYMFLGALFIWIPAGLLSKSIPFLAGIMLGTLVISNLFIVVHRSVHHPGAFLMLDRQKWFGVIYRQHHVHHTNLDVNFNLLFPLADWLFGTFRPQARYLEVTFPTISGIDRVSR